MLRRIERVMTELRNHALVARELSLGLYHAVSVFTRGRSAIDEGLIDRHEERVLRELPGF